MATLKGQNFRILTNDGTKDKVIAKSTSCTVTLGTNTDDSGTKDDVGAAQKPVVTSKNWSVQVETLDVTDVAAMLTAIKNMTPFTLKWDETATADNQTAQKASFGRTGKAFLNDATFSFNDRENSTKSLQFTGSGPLTAISGNASTDIVAVDGAYTKGEKVRLFLGSDNTATPDAVIAAAKQLSLHVSLTLESASTKDTDDDWDIQEPTGIAFDISTNALVRSGDTITSTTGAKSLSDLESIYEASSPVRFQIANVSGANNRTKGGVIVSGSVIVSSLTIQSPNRQNATYDASLTGFGAYTVGA